MTTEKTPRLVLLNGPPGIGKSTLARRYVRDRPLSFCLDIDGFRRLVGQWEAHEEASGLLAREMALAMARTHLAARHDVVVPQYVARPEFIDRLAWVARDAGALFYEVYLTDAKPAALARFHDRAHDPDAAQHHSEAARAVGGCDALGQMFDALEDVRKARTASILIETMAGREDDAYEQLVVALDETKLE